jgi:hypothetical protein
LLPPFWATSFFIRKKNAHGIILLQTFSLLQQQPILLKSVSPLSPVKVSGAYTHSNLQAFVSPKWLAAHK